MPANVEAVESQISQLTSLLKSLNTDLHPQLQPFQKLFQTRIPVIQTILISYQLSVINDLCVYSKLDAPANVKMVESQLSQLVSLL